MMCIVVGVAKAEDKLFIEIVLSFCHLEISIRRLSCVVKLKWRSSTATYSARHRSPHSHSLTIPCMTASYFAHFFNFNIECVVQKCAAISTIL